MGGEGDSSEPGAVINIRCSNGTKFSVRMSLETMVGTFKEVVAQNCDVPPDQQRLIYKGRILKDDQRLESYGLQADHTIHMVRGSSQTNVASAPTSTLATNNNSTPAVTRGVGSNDGGVAGVGASLFPGLASNPLSGGGAPGLFGAGLPELGQMQQHVTQNSNMMREIMNMPAVQNLINNPELMRGLIMSNPQMRELVDQNPELAHILNDPSILRQTLEAARNPELMHEMMRNSDRAMNNIEATPEGFNMLRRMYENVQEPFLNATAAEGNGRSDLSSNPFAALLGSQGGATRDSANNSLTTGPETATDTAPNTNPLPNPWNSTGGAQANTIARLNQNQTGNVTSPALGDLRGAGLPGMDQMFTGIPDASLLNQLMQNPAVSQMMQSVFSNPEYVNQILNSNPQLRSMVELNPQLREMLQNPELLRQLTSPEMMQQVLSQLTRQQPNQGAANAGGTTGAPTGVGLDLLMNMFGGLGAGGFNTVNTPNAPPEELYATQLSQLQEMGFFDTQENIRALRATSGNVHAAVERLLGNLGQ
ncbi:hypothetical protein SAY86_022060 [Trapa natans]|uniref:Ubiquitin domain-containing protein DSK2a-like n=1 Tax=Trapa natans TaxID=22666 RepID=A0AAN7RM90_TRANT|nr:hypothetical protein SAY86_022060 [Trapa natans]